MVTAHLQQINNKFFNNLYMFCFDFSFYTRFAPISATLINKNSKHKEGLYPNICTLNIVRDYEHSQRQS